MIQGKVNEIVVDKAQDWGERAGPPTRGSVLVHDASSIRWPKQSDQKPQKAGKCLKTKMEISSSLRGYRNCSLSKQGQFLSKHSRKFIALHWDQSLQLCSLITAIHHPLSVDNCLTFSQFQGDCMFFISSSFSLCDRLLQYAWCQKVILSSQTNYRIKILLF